MTTNRVPGRPRSISTEHFDTVLKLYADGEAASSPSLTVDTAVFEMGLGSLSAHRGVSIPVV